MSTSTTPRKSSRQTDSDSDSDQHVVLNSPRETVDLTEPHCDLASQGRKRRASPTESSGSSERSRRRHEAFRKIYNDWSYIKSGCQYMMREIERMRDPVVKIMDIINHLYLELEVPMDTYLRACEYVTDPNRARMLLKMTDEGRRYWLTSCI
jgi:dynactin complex subunit